MNARFLLLAAAVTSPALAPGSVGRPRSCGDLKDDVIDRNGRSLHALGEGEKRRNLLSERAIAGVLERKRALLEIIDAKAADGGDDATFFFP